MEVQSSQIRALKRLDLIRTQIINNKCLNTGKVPEKTDDDVVIVAAVRTPMTKSGRGPLKDTQTEQLIKPVLEELLRRGKIKGENVQEIAFGNVLQPGAAFYAARMAQFLAGFPDSTNLMTVNRLCSSGLQATMTVAYSIASRQIDVGIGGGIEQMSMFDMNNSLDAEKISEEVFNTPKASSCMTPMGITSENVAEQFKVDRKTQDEFALNSQRKAAAAQKNGLFNDEIVPVKTKVKDKNGNWTDVTVTKDDGIRETTIESLQKLKPSFKQGGTTTAGNSSQITDGAAGVLLMRRSVAKKLGAPILARIIGYSVTGVPAEVMGIGPAFAIPDVLAKTGLKIDDIDIFEINEAFASQATYCAKKLNIPAEKINPKGGAIALGHPLGMTGARQFATLLPELKRQNKRFGIISMCIGTGMGAACVVERE